MIQLTNISAAYNDHPVLSHFSLQIATGEQVALAGPNGAGKSSLLRVLSGQLAAQGSVRLAGREASRLTPRERARLLAVVPQEMPRDIPLTAHAFVMLGRTAWLPRFGAPAPADGQAVHEAMVQTETWALRHRPLSEMSGGERQRLALALALAGEPRVLLLDEPTSHLDLKHSAALMRLLVRINQERQTTILMAVHDLTLASHHFPRLVLLDRGVKIADGAPSNVLRTDLLTALYGCKVHVAPLSHGAAVYVPPLYQRVQSKRASTNGPVG